MFSTHKHGDRYNDLKLKTSGYFDSNDPEWQKHSKLSPGRGHRRST